MKYIVTILCLIGLSYGQTFGWDYGVPTWVKFGDNPTGTIDMKGDTLIVSDVISSPSFTSPSATSYLSMYGDTLFFTRTGAAGDHDQVICFVDESGNKSCLFVNDDKDRIESNIEFLAVFLTSTGTIRGNSVLEFTGTTPVIDPENNGAGTLQLGETGDHDITSINSRLTTTITTVDTTTVMGAADGFMYTMTVADTLKCPVTPLAGEVLEAKFTHASGGLLFGNGNNIDGATEVAASENDNIRIVWNATASEWEVR